MYEIEFTYREDVCWIPATYPPGVPHYDAQVQVWEVKRGKIDYGTFELKELIAKFGGTYTKGLCYEDEPIYLIKKALKIQREEKVEETLKSLGG